MKIIVHGINYRPEPVGIAIYTADLAESFVADGHCVTVVTANPSYPIWRVAAGFSRWRWSSAIESGVHITRCPLYVPVTPSGMRRILHYVSFVASSSVPVLWAALTQRPQLIFAVAPSLVSASTTLLAARLTGATSWLHIQDFEVEAAFATGALSGSGLIATLARRFERWILRRFDTVSSISPEMCERLRAKGVADDRIFELRNWADSGAVNPLHVPSPYRTRWGIIRPHVALYSGNIAQKQGIDIVVEAARLLAHRRDLIFVICGEGPNRAALEALAADLDNVQVHDLQPRKDLGALLGLATVHLLPQKADAADLVLPSKLTNMLASKRAVVATAWPGTGLYREVEGCGIVCPPENIQLFAEAIERLLDDPPLREICAEKAATAAAERWSKSAILDLLRRRMTNIETAFNPDTADAHP